MPADPRASRMCDALSRTKGRQFIASASAEPLRFLETATFASIFAAALDRSAGTVTRSWFILSEQRSEGDRLNGWRTVYYKQS